MVLTLNPIGAILSDLIPNDKLQRRGTGEGLWNRKKTALSPVRCKLLLGESVIWLSLKNKSVPFFLFKNKSVPIFC